MPRPKGSKNKSKVSSKTIRDILLGRFRMDELETFLNMTVERKVDGKVINFKKNLYEFYFDLIPKLMPKVQEVDSAKASSLTINLGAEEVKGKQPKLEQGKTPVPEPPLNFTFHAESQSKPSKG